VPVYEQTYHHYTGVYRPRSQCWMVITLNGLKQAWRSKWVRFILLFCNFNSIVFIGRMYLAANKELMDWLGMPTNVTDQLFLVSDSTFFEFLTIQFFSCWLMTLFIGSDLISMDRRTKSISLYLSKPLSRFDYVLGKGMTVMAMLYAITLIPALLMVFLNGIFMDDWFYWIQSFPLIAKIFIFSHIICVPLTLVVLAISRWCIFYPESSPGLLKIYLKKPYQTPLIMTPGLRCCRLRKSGPSWARPCLAKQT